MNPREPMLKWSRHDRNGGDAFVLHTTGRFNGTDWEKAHIRTVLNTVVRKWKLVLEKCEEINGGNDETHLPVACGGAFTCAACQKARSGCCSQCLLLQHVDESYSGCCGTTIREFDYGSSTCNARAVLAYVEAIYNAVVDDDPTIPLQVFLDAAKANFSGTGNGLVSAWVKDDTQCAIIHVSRYAMDGMGGGVGHEEYYGTLAIIPRNDEKVVVPSAMQIHWEPAQPPIETTEIDAEARLRDNGIEFNREEDDLVELAGEHGLYEGDYCPPDDDFAWQELEHHLGEIIKTAIKEQVK